MVVRDAACLVTGGSSGIGRATALALARAGARVVVTGRDEARLRETAARCGSTAIVADLATREGLDRVVEQAGPVDVLVNNAGIGWAGPLTAMTPEEIGLLVQVNLVAPAQLTRALLPGMLERGRGHVVNVASVAGHVPVRGEVLYAATKAALASLTDGLRQELVATPVRVTLVSPGVVDTPIFEHRGVPYGRSRPRPIAAERIAAAIVRGIERDARLVIAPWWLRLPVRLHAVAPVLYDRLAHRWG